MLCHKYAPKGTQNLEALHQNLPSIIIRNLFCNAYPICPKIQQF